MDAMSDDGRPAQDYKLVKGLSRVLLLKWDGLNYSYLPPTPEGERSKANAQLALW